MKNILPLLFLPTLFACDSEEYTTSKETSELEQALADALARIDALESEVSVLATESSLSTLQAQVDTNTTGLAALTTEVDGLDSAVGLIESDLSALVARVDGLDTTTADIETDLANLDAEVDGIDSDLASLSGEVDSIDSDLASLSDEVDDIEPGIADLSTYLSVDTSTDTVLIDGANLQVVSGSGSTSGTVNGLGNVLIGYDEDSGDDKSGSHNLVMGRYHSYASYGSIVHGYNHSITSGGLDSATLGGLGASISARGSVAVSGVYGVLDDEYAATMGGYGAEIGSGGVYSVAISGAYPTANHGSAVVLGGYGEETSSSYDVIIP